MCIDEADLVVNTQSFSQNKSLKASITSMICNAQRVICCTATPLGILFKDDFDTTCSNIVHLPIPKNYHGLNDLNIQILTHDAPKKLKFYNANAKSVQI